MSWVNGRQLASASDGTGTYSYIYDAAGSRIMKNVGTVNHLYFYVNGMLLMEYRYNAMGDTTDVLQYFYDANGKPHAMAYNGTVYLYVTNLQGDIVALLGLDGTVSGYEYDPYGNVIASYGDIAAINPLRYRGYYYDNETGLYYLQSRYYDPVVGRFINADDISNLAGNSGFASYNLFAYCGNSPVTRKDEGGTLWNYVIGAVVGGTVSAITAARQTYVEEGSINWAKTIISGTVGAVSGGIAASGLSWIAQAGYTSLTAAVGDIGVQITDVVTKKKHYNVKQTIHNSILAGGSSVVGSALGAITSYGKSTISSELLESASKKASTAVVRNSIGKSSSKLARQAQRHFAEGIKQQNIARGISSVTGTVLTWGATTRYTY